MFTSPYDQKCTYSLIHLLNSCFPGFKEAKIACCGSGPYRGLYSCGGMRGETEYELCSNVSEYMFFDSFHPTERFYQQLAELAWRGTHNVIKPYNLKQLFGNSQEEIPCNHFDHPPYTSVP